MRPKFVALLLIAAVGCTSVSENEHCVETRYGKVVTERMAPGLNGTFLTDATCFPLTDQNYPDTGAFVFTAMAKDSILVTGRFSWVWAHNPNEIVQLYRAKRDRDLAEREIIQGAQTGLQNAIAQFRSDELYSKPEQVDATLKASIDRVQQGRAVTRRAFLRNVLPPTQILEARREVQQKDLALQAAQRQLAVDSMVARGKIIQANATSEAKRLEAQSYGANTVLKDIEIAKELAKICGNAQTCILGGSTMDALLRGVRQ